MEKAKVDGLDCVLMDLKMPGINGAETLEIIKELKRDLPVMLMRAYATEAQTEEAKREGACPPRQADRHPGGTSVYLTTQGKTFKRAAIID